MSYVGITLRSSNMATVVMKFDWSWNKSSHVIRRVVNKLVKMILFGRENEGGQLNYYLDCVAMSLFPDLITLFYCHITASYKVVLE